MNYVNEKEGVCNMNRKTTGLYIHIPFCVQKCLYCDFASGPASEKIKRDYVNCLLKEIELSDEEYDSLLVDTVFIGGGTPSVLNADWMEEILCKLKELYEFTKDCECTIEVNPGTVDVKKLKKYREMGINRLSIGLQSCNDNELKALGRIHDFNTFEKTYSAAREAGFQNINIDLMSSIPEQTEESFIRSLKRVLALNPEHISVYSLIVEEGTPFYEMDLRLPDEEEERRIYHETGELLKEYGYEQYEISNYAKPGMECKHNIRYWQCEEYIGFGVAAASYFNGVRRKNTENTDRYLKYMQNAAVHFNPDMDALYCEKEILTQADMISEFMFMGLRMNKGISKEEFCRRFGCTPEAKFGEMIAKHTQNGLLQNKDDYIRLTDKGRDICNYIMADFLL